MLSKIKSFFLSLTLLTFLTPEAYSATADKKVCVASNGAVTVKSKCKKTEKLLSAITLNQTIASSSEVVGPVGSQGTEGVPGPQGIQGPVGISGPQGPVGNASSVKGPKGGINIAACRMTSLNSQGALDQNLFTPGDSWLYAYVNCDQATEFLLEDEAKITLFTAGTKVALQGRTSFTSGDKEYGVGYDAVRVSAGNGTFQITVRAFCCPR